MDLFTDFPEISANLPEPATMLKPLFKWVGGKTQMVPLLRKMVEEGIPGGLENIKTYREPFLGGGAVFLDFQHGNNVVNDINPFIVNVYQSVRDNPEELMNQLDEWDMITCTNDYYLEKREHFNNVLEHGVMGTTSAALFLFINRHCFNGLYRVNRKGQFNASWNKEPHVKSYHRDTVNTVSKFLKDSDTVFMVGDYEEAVKSAVAGDFVFFDSPYDEVVTGGFAKYDKSGFKRDDHVRLSQVFKKLTDAGVHCMATNHGTDLIRDLYAGFDIVTIDVRRSVSASGSTRTGSEVIITNFGSF